MAIEYGFYLDTAGEVEDVVRAVSASLPGSTAEASEAGALATELLDVQVGNFPGSQLVTAYVGAPSVVVLFRLNKFSMVASRQTVARAVSHLLNTFDGDAVLIHNWEFVDAWRHGEELVVGEKSQLHLAMLEHLRVPYRVGDIPVRRQMCSGNEPQGS